MNRSVLDVGGGPPRRLAVHAARRRPQGAPAVLLGRGAARGGEPALRALRGAPAAVGPRVATGVFRAMMDVALVNQGPVTILLLDSATALLNEHALERARRA